MPLLHQWVRSFRSWLRTGPKGSFLGLTYPPARCCGSCMSHHYMACSSKSVNNAVEQCCKGRRCMVLQPPKVKQQIEVSEHNARTVHVVQPCMIRSPYACTRCASCLAISNQVCTIWPRGSLLKSVHATNRATLTDDMNLHQAGTSQGRNFVECTVACWAPEYSSCLASLQEHITN